MKIVNDLMMINMNDPSLKDFNFLKLQTNDTLTVKLCDMYIHLNKGKKSESWIPKFYHLHGKLPCY